MPALVTPTSEQREVKRAEHVMNNEAAKRALRVIFPLLEVGKALTRSEIVSAFREAGYVERLAEQRADQFILIHTNPRKWCPFVVSRNADGVLTYGMGYEKRRRYAEQAA